MDSTRHRDRLLPLLIALVLPVAATSATAEPDTARYRQLVTEIQQAQRGPFSRLRWYCHDGTSLLPAQGDCTARGGGIQHGEWSDQARELRDAGYPVATVLGDYAVPRSQPLQTLDATQLKHILLERFLVEREDGWIFGRARFYRGALQIEDELAGAERIRRWALDNFDSKSQDYLLLRETNRLLPQPMASASAERVRNMATQLAERDPKFEPFRVKIHGLPQPDDVQAIRDYASNGGNPALKRHYLSVANELEALFVPDLGPRHQTWLRGIKDTGLLGKLHYLYESLEQSSDPLQRLGLMSDILFSLRDGMQDQHLVLKQMMLNASLDLEPHFFAVASEQLGKLDQASRQQRLQWLQAVIGGIYGQGFISRREWQSTQRSLATLLGKAPTLSVYRGELNALNRAPGWATRWLNFHFSDVLTHFSQIEPEVNQYIPARLRGSSLQFFSAVLDSLLQDANHEAGVAHSLMGKTAGTGIRALNAGLAKGVLHFATAANQPLDPDGIYVLPHTTAELTPVAGIITLGEGNALSHVQLLAANLGIPNIVMDNSTAESLRQYDGKPVVLAVSPAGMVEIALADKVDPALFEADKDAPPEVAIVPDLEKLDLRHTGLKTLSNLRSSDSGRIAGPKAANLGELKHFFPLAVAEGVVIPFGVFNAMLDTPIRDGGESLRQWMLKNYQQIDNQKGELRDLTIEVFLKELRYHLEHIELGEAFDAELRQTLQTVFGDDGSYAVFVRSDTNIEDLPGFTGAGLNLTVPNVVGVDNVIKAIKRVWASPFTERAFAWRQGRMQHPEHVYPSILLMKTVPVQKSGVMLTLDTETGDKGKYSVATNWGIGGVVAGQSSEELLLNADSYDVRLREEATNPIIKVIDNMGGLKKEPAKATGKVLEDVEVLQLLALGRQAEVLLPQYDEQGEPTPADIEFGFLDNTLQLFQIRPYLRNKRAHQHQYLLNMDAGLQGNDATVIDLTRTPAL